MKLRLLALAGLAAAAVLAAGAAAEGGKGRLYVFGGELLAAPGANATSVSLQVESGNEAALRALLGSSQDQVLALGPGTEVLIWQHGVPHVGTTSDLQQGDAVTVRVRAPRGASLQQIESTPASVVADRGTPGAGGRPLWLFVGTVGGPQSGGHLALHVTSGNWRALQAMLGQQLDQTFTYDGGTIFLLWKGRVPTVIDPSQLVAGDRITVRVRPARLDARAGRGDARRARRRPRAGPGAGDVARAAGRARPEAPLGMRQIAASSRKSARAAAIPSGTYSAVSRSFGAWTCESGRPKPVRITGIPRSAKAGTIGSVPPERTRSGRRPRTRSNASRPSSIARAAGGTSPGGEDESRSSSTSAPSGAAARRSRSTSAATSSGRCPGASRTDRLAAASTGITVFCR